jgi:DNA-binding NtrC family response regulator
VSLGSPRPELAALVRAHLSNLDRVSVTAIAERAYAIGKEEGTTVKPESMLEGTLAAVERRAIEYAYSKCGGNMVATAKALDMGKTTLYRKLRDYGVYRGPVCAKCGAAGRAAGEVKA